jgi:hypothetical protein
MSHNFAMKYCALSVKAARRANRLSVRLRRSADASDKEQAAIFRAFAVANIREAKARKADARQNGAW